MKTKGKNKVQQEPKTTGHEWDGIREYDNPAPQWLKVIFYGALFFALIYWILYPSWPAQDSHGVLDWTEYNELTDSLAEIKKIRSEYLDEFNKASLEEILKNPRLLKFAIAGGRAAFQNNCAVCHGAGGNGNPGYPNLTAGAWLWGGKIDDIYLTVKNGIRSGHEDARDSQMAAFGKDKILKPEEVDLLVNYVLNLSSSAITNGEAYDLYQKNCAICHGEHGEGRRDVGAPALKNVIWLYGRDAKIVYDVIYNGRQGVMPFWVGKLDDSTIKQLAVYVHQLGGGE